MTAPRLIFLDTTVFSTASALDTPGWDSLADAISAGVIEVAVSEVTVRELTRQIREKITSFNAKVTAAQSDFRDHGIAEPSQLDVNADTYQEQLRARLRERGVAIRGLPTVSHDDLVARDLSVRKPFNRAGKGYRDALIWHTFMEWLREKDLVGVHVSYVSANTDDFAGADKKSLAADLKTDLPVDGEVALITSLIDVVDHVRKFKNEGVAEPVTVTPEDPMSSDDEDGDVAELPSALDTAESAALSAFHAIEGEAWDADGVFPFRLYPVEEATVVWIDVEEDSLESTLVDTVSYSMIWDVRASATLHVEGSVNRADVFQVMPGWEISDAGDMSDRYVDAYRTYDCTLVADVRVEHDHTTAEGVVTQVKITADPR